MEMMDEKKTTRTEREASMDAFTEQLKAEMNEAARRKGFENAADRTRKDASRKGKRFSGAHWVGR